MQKGRTHFCIDIRLIKDFYIMDKFTIEIYDPLGI